MSPVIGFHRALLTHPDDIPDFPYVWLEAPLQACLARRTEVPNWKDLTAWPAGRIFGEQGEYRWQWQANERLHAVLLLEDSPLPSVFKEPVELESPEESSEESSFVLWGEWVDLEKDPQGNPDGGPLFYANEIPDVQRYPIAIEHPLTEDDLPRLIIRRYRATNKDMGEFVRCVGFTIRARKGGG